MLYISKTETMNQHCAVRIIRQLLINWPLSRKGMTILNVVGSNVITGINIDWVLTGIPAESRKKNFPESYTTNSFKTITVEIHARSLAKFYGQFADGHMNLKFMGRVSPVIDNEFRHNIVKVVCVSTRQSPRGSTATLTMW